MPEIKKITGDFLADFIIDAKNCYSPTIVLRAKKKIAELKKGDILQIDVTDPRSGSDCSSWCERSDHEFIGEEIVEGFTRYLIRK